MFVISRGDAFLKAYRNNLGKQNQHALEASQVAQAMIRLMQKRMSEGFGLSVCLEGIHYFKGSMTELRKIKSDSRNRARY